MSTCTDPIINQLTPPPAAAPTAPSSRNTNNGNRSSVPSTATATAAHSAPLITNGNIQVGINVVSGLVVVTRVSDGTVLLNQSVLLWGVPQERQASRPNTVTVQVRFNGLDANESIYGLGEHKNGRVEQGAAAVRGPGYANQKKLCPAGIQLPRGP